MLLTVLSKLPTSIPDYFYLFSAMMMIAFYWKHSQKLASNFAYSAIC